MVTVNVLLGLMFIVLGFLTLKFPWMIKQWRYASEEQRKNIDIKGLQLLCCKSMVVSGLALIVVGIVNYFIEGTWPTYALIIIVVAMAGYMVARSRRFDKNKQSKKDKTIKAAVLAVTLFLVVGLFIGGKTETKVGIVDDNLQIGGMYGETIALDAIDTVYMSTLSNLPEIEMRTNGYADGQILKGYFRLADWGKCKLFVHDMKAEVIVIEYEGKHLIMNLYEADATKNLYNELQDF